MFGRLTHYAFDAVLFSAFLAGVKRSTGLTLILRVPPWVVWGSHSPSLKSEQISENKEVKRWVDNYLGVGEWVMDQSVAVMGSSSWFERRR
ncbi:uncharacterized protein N7443_010040 [Penicillium atrosanguineum]|uniref:DUF1748-domain-containing protein n=1 Tax=Penicillium atrosanguineum TaxID=1132637 RepID=A0A9W9U1W6_9EURO|nr:uncharacterized protein N7443_010040 [Penicillium atrosanguineum]KAJ5289787.1 hypothetical protein N7443_010040 [Penicillium atrosanguineum]KAJ5307609.1 hypothetical protein N7476_008265 [Penicillium atrosanguineum]